MGTVRVRLERNQAIRGDRGRMDTGRSLRSSPRAGKPSTWRRGAGDRWAFDDGGNLWTQMQRPIRSGSSACRESSISGVGRTPKEQYRESVELVY